MSFPSSVCSNFSKGLSRLGSMPYSVGAPLMEVRTLYTRETEREHTDRKFQGEKVLNSIRIMFLGMQGLI